VILGEGGERGYLEAEVERFGMNGKVLLPGYVANASRFLPLFKVFVLSSLTEGLPMVILEAMRAGVPIIATRVGGIPEMLENGNSGTLVNPDNCKDLALGITNVFNNPSHAAQKVDIARKRLLKKYSNIIMYENYLEIYRRSFH
jgi:glycosyltransferase involved in cell wall biosynthesis